MPYNPNIHNRKSIRLKGYDYSQAGLYFITICVQNRICLFGDVINGKMMLNDAGKMVENEWLKLPLRFSNIQLHEFVVMPNHFHSIIEILDVANMSAHENVALKNNLFGNVINVDNENDIDHAKILVNAKDEGQPQGIAPAVKPKTVGDMVGAFQSIVTVEYIRGVKNLGWKPFHGKLWHRNYWDNIIRNKQSFERITKYIVNNPKNWKNDKLNGKFGL